MHVKTTLALTALVAGFTSDASGQGARGAGPDALPLPAGAFRVSAATTWQRHVDSYFDGTVKELGAAYSTDSLTAFRVSALTVAEARARTASALGTFRATLGALNTHARESFESSPLAIEYGVTSRLSVGVTVPFVTRTLRADVVANPLGTEANMGINPALSVSGAASANGTLITQLEAAASALNGRITSCAAAPNGAGCSAINGNPGAAQSLVTESLAYATAVAQLYGGKTGVTPSPFVPTAGSAAQTAVAARLAGFKTAYATYGSTVTAGAPVGAAPLTTAAFQSILTDSAYGFLVNPLGSVVRRGIGDLELKAQFTWHDSYATTAKTGGWRERLWWRSAIGGTYRLATGENADPREIIPLPLGEGAPAFDARFLLDVGVGTRWSISSTAGYSLRGQVAGATNLVGAIGTPFSAGYSGLTSGINLGDVITIEVAPRLSPIEAMSIAATWAFRHKAAEENLPAPSVASGSALAPALAVGGAETEHRVGASLAYSTLAAHQRGVARWPLEISIAHYQTISGSGSSVPKLSYDAVTLRWYRLRRPQPPTATPGRARD